MVNPPSFLNVKSFKEFFLARFTRFYFFQALFAALKNFARSETRLQSEN
jgi:hypothetical protein